MKIVLVPHALIAPLTAAQVARVTAAASGERVEVPRTDAAAHAAVADAEIVFGDLRLDLLDAATEVRWVQSVGAGVNQIADHLGSRPVLLTGSVGVVGPQLAEHAFALLLSLTRGVAAAIRNPGWEHRKAIRDTQWELTDRTLCVVGFGGAGREVARRARGFGFERIIAVDPSTRFDPQLADELVAPADIDRVLGTSDVVVLTAPLTPENTGWFDAARFAAMKAGSILINVSRGGLVQEQPLLQALRSGHLYGAGLDVAPIEPLPAGHPLWDMPNVVITPHNAGGSPRRADRVVDSFRDNLVRYLAGLPLIGAYDRARGF